MAAYNGANAETCATGQRAGFNCYKVSVIGTCIETLDRSGNPLAAAVTTEGNYAICHWLYFERGETLTSNAAYSNQLRGGVNGEWGETVYLNEAEWASSGSRITGESIRTLGTPISADYGFARSGFADTAVTSTYTFQAMGVYQMSWYQPKYAQTYSKDGLRRYQGGSEDASKVKGYCVGPRNIDATTANDRIYAAT